MKRIAEIHRKTKETDILIKFDLDGKGKSKIKTGIAFLDHMLDLFAYHGLFNLDIKAKGDLDVDIHHTNEDIGIALGEAFKKALKAKKGISRFGQSFVPMDESLSKVRVVLDISGRPSLYFNTPKFFRGGDYPIKGYSINDAQQLLRAFALNAGVNMHVDIIRGEDTHHALESVFKALGRALSEAASIDVRRKNKIPSTKGKL